MKKLLFILTSLIAMGNGNAQTYHDIYAFEDLHIVLGNVKEYQLEYHDNVRKSDDFALALLTVLFFDTGNETYKFDKNGRLSNAGELGITEIKRNSNNYIISYKKDNVVYTMKYESRLINGMYFYRLKTKSWNDSGQNEYRFIYKDNISDNCYERHKYFNGELVYKTRLANQRDIDDLSVRYVYYYPAEEEELTSDNYDYYIKLKSEIWPVYNDKETSTSSATSKTAMSSSTSSSTANSSDSSTGNQSTYSNTNPPSTPIVKKNITTKEMIEKPFCCVQGTWESLTKKEILSQLKANGYSCDNNVSDNHFSLWDLESYIYELPINHCTAFYNENEKLRSYSFNYYGTKYSRNQVQEIVKKIQDDIRNMGAAIEHEVKGRYMVAYYQDKEIKVDYDEIEGVNEKGCKLNFEVWRDDYPVNIIIQPKDFSIQELINYSFGFIKSRNIDEIYKTLKTNKWNAQKKELYSPGSYMISSIPDNNKLQNGFTFLGIPIGSYVSTYENNKLEKMSYRAIQSVSTMNKKESDDVIQKHKVAYDKIMKDLENEGGIINVIQKKKTLKKFQAKFPEKCVIVSYGYDGLSGLFDIEIKWD